MRLFLLIAFGIFFQTISFAQHKPTTDETVKWLRAKTSSGSPGPGHAGTHRNSTKMCKDFNLHQTNDNPGTEHFTTRIESLVSWTKNEVKVQNNIYQHDKLSETYTYHIPLTAIAGASVTNCKLNASGNVNAYHDRPIFLHIKKNTTKVSCKIYNKKGSRPISHMNKNDADWDSYIPLAGNWDRDDKLMYQILEAFARLAEINGTASL